jgi:hypothetical protein
MPVKYVGGFAWADEGDPTLIALVFIYASVPLRYIARSAVLLSPAKYKYPFLAS